MRYSNNHERRKGRALACALSSALLALFSGCNGEDSSNSAGAAIGDDPSRPGPISLEERIAMLDPKVDEAQGEVFNAAASKQLEIVERLILHPAEVSEAELVGLVDDDFNGDHLRPTDLEVEHSSAALRVLRSPSVAHGLSEPEAFGGRSGLRLALGELGAVLEEGSDVHVKWKILRVEELEDVVRTTIYYQTYGTGAVHHFATWIVNWTPARESVAPRLTSIDLSSFEETQRVNVERPLFIDATRSVLGSNSCYENQILPSLNHWRGLLDRSLGVNLDGHQGISLGDVDGDGLEDLYVCRGGGLPNRLYLRSADGSLREASQEAGLDVLDLTRSALILDFDGDGDQDLVLASSALTFFENDGRGVFRVAARFPAISNAMSICAADYDQDGDLDVYACRYDAPEAVAPLPYHDAQNGPPNVLLRNEGDLRFRDVTESSGLDVGNGRYSFAATWEDYDNDGDQDLYVANDYGRNNLYRNDGGKFTEVAASSGVEDISAGMSVTWGDYDRDGAMDLYVSNMFSSAGNRVTFQRNFKTDLGDSTRGEFQRHARGNSLFENAADGSFRDVSVERHVTMGRWAWGALFSDLNSDGFQDLYVANGFLTNEISTDL